MGVLLSTEQQEFIDVALSGRNILVDACIGSGKTTSIQQLCNRMKNKTILYLTYNKLLKIDAQDKIINENVTVTNYHGFANMYVKAGVAELITVFNKLRPNIGLYDVLIIDEYQDIEQEIADMLNYIRSTNRKMQIISVGDMEQKIYDKTTLDISKFIERFIPNAVKISFTQCFRIGASLSEFLSRVWNKPIKGVNSTAKTEYWYESQILDFLKDKSPREIMCIGSKKGITELFNLLHDRYPKTFNKRTVYGKIDDNNSFSGSVSPGSDTAIFTTFDGCKGLERPICILYDWTEEYWNIRASMPMTKYEILRNIFCVAASRGKEYIIFAKQQNERDGKISSVVSEATLSEPFDSKLEIKSLNISRMFDFKYKESIEECYNLLKIKNITKQNKLSELEIKAHDALIDLSPCIGTFQEASFFKNYDIDLAIKIQELDSNKNYARFKGSDMDLNSMLKKVDTSRFVNLNLQQKILYLTSLETKHQRYNTQVELPFINKNQEQLINDRLSKLFSPYETVQKSCEIKFFDYKDNRSFSALGITDVIKDNMIYELKFVSQLQYTHFLQLACYLVAMKIEKGILYNTYDDTMFSISVAESKKFLNAVTNCITKGKLERYEDPKEQNKNKFFSIDDKDERSRELEKTLKQIQKKYGEENIYKASVSHLSKPKHIPFTNTEQSVYKVGTKVEHEKFGKGMIVSLSGSSKSNLYGEVMFVNKGKITLHLGYAPLTIL